MKRLPILFSILFLVMLGFGIIIPVMPYYAESLGATEAIFGWLMASYSIMQFIFSPIWGKISDRIGRKPVLLIGISGYIITFSMFAFANQLWELFFARILAGILSSATLPTAMAVVADTTSEEDRGKGMGILGAGMGLGFIFGPAIGGILSKYSILGMERLATPFLFTAALSIIPFIMTLFLLPESLSKDKGKRKPTQKKYRFAITYGHLTIVYLTAFIVSFTLAGLEGTFAYFAKDRTGVTSHDLGYIFAIMGIASAFVQGGVIGKLIKKYGEEKTIKLGLLISSVGFLLIIFAHSFFTMALFLAIFGMGNGMMRPSISSLISKKTKSGQGIAIGVMDSMDSLGRMIGPPLAGSLYLYFMDTPYILGAVLTFVFMILFHVFYQ
ncbi:MFS transporter [Tepidibacillus sp. LV47]|uniref:MFS transporter n=1 Tax=Tepidibacillus sp. LV47 TaxID=3398228 RepID=UPI003AAFC21D